MEILELENFSASANGRDIVKGISLKVKPGETHLVMGRNGSGKSTLLSAIAGKPSLKADGKMLFAGKDLAGMKPHERAREGIFMAFQNPIEVPGVNLASFLKQAYSSRFGRDISIAEFDKLLFEKMDLLGIPRQFAERGLNEDFSGGEKKKSELLQMALLSPKLAMVDEIDSGLDVDSLALAGNALAGMKKQGAAIILVSHQGQLLDNISPDFVHVMINGKIALAGGRRIAEKISKEGYGWVESSV